MREGFEVPCLAAHRLAHPLGQKFDFAFAGREHREEPVSVGYVSPAQHKHMGGSNTCSFCHGCIIAHNTKKVESGRLPLSTFIGKTDKYAG
jgi:hypothetical protein